MIGSDKPSAKQIMELLCTLANAAYYRDRECFFARARAHAAGSLCPSPRRLSRARLRAQARKSILFFACERVSMPDSPVC